MASNSLILTLDNNRLILTEPRRPMVSKRLPMVGHQVRIPMVARTPMVHLRTERRTPMEVQVTRHSRDKRIPTARPILMVVGSPKAMGKHNLDTASLNLDMEPRLRMERSRHNSKATVGMEQPANHTEVSRTEEQGFIHAQ